MQRVLVLDSTGAAVMPTHPARARQLLRSGRAICVRRTPFTIRLGDRDRGATQPMRLNELRGNPRPMRAGKDSA